MKQALVSSAVQGGGNASRFVARSDWDLGRLFGRILSGCIKEISPTIPQRWVGGVGCDYRDRVIFGGVLGRAKGG